MSRCITCVLCVALMMFSQFSIADGGPVSLGNVFGDTLPAVSPKFDFEDRRAETTVLNADNDEVLQGAKELGDNCLPPSLPEFFKNSLIREYVDQLDGVHVTLDRLTVYSMDLSSSEINEADYQRAVDSTRASIPNANPLGLLLGRILVGQIEKWRGKTKLVVVLAGSIDGTPFYSQAEGIYRGRGSQDEIRGVVAQAIMNADTTIRARFVKNSITLLSEQEDNTVGKVGGGNPTAQMTSDEAETTTVNCVVKGERVWTRPSKCDP